METTEFSGAPQGDDSRPGGTEPGVDPGFFAPAPVPSSAPDEPDQIPTELVSEPLPGSMTGQAASPRRSMTTP